VTLVALAVLASVAAGAITERRRREDAQRASARMLDVMLYVLVPFVTFFNIAHLRVSSGVGAGIGLAYLELAIVGALAWLAATRWLHLERPAVGALICAAVLANTGYLGLPMTLAVLGSKSLASAIAFDALVSGPMLLVVGFGLGAAYGTRAGESRTERLRAFVSRNPPLLAVAAGLLAPAGAAPHELLEISRGVVIALLPLGFFVLGVTLSAEAEEGILRLRPASARALAVAVGLRLIVAPALLLGFSAALVSVPDSYLLQAAMPSGINTLLVAHAYGLDQRLASGAIAWSTALVILVGVGAAAV
jgi:predicted permease